ncbi:MAG: hypothetical protein FJ297_14595 [Planctomycetes bacterium]|nr:hypothetical protein [Planctomycetota bacterium]
MNRPIRVVFLGFAMGCAAASVARAQAGGSDPAKAEANVDERQPTVIEWTVTPRATPHFALEYRLLPGMHERSPGNAAPFHYRSILAMKMFCADYEKQYHEKSERWLKWPPDAEAVAEMREWIKAYQGQVFEQLRVAVHRERCDWEFRIHELTELSPIMFVLEEIQQARGVARALQIQARLQMLDGKTDEAIETLRMGFQLSRDVSEAPILINSLVGIAIASMMVNEVQHFAELESSPNLYWALATLPHPMFEMRPAMEQEMGLVHQIFPFLKDVETTERTPEEWNRLLQEMIDRVIHLTDGTQQQDWKERLGLSVVSAAAYPRAKQALIDAGFPADRVEAMPAAQVIAIQTARVTRYARDETIKWSFLPYLESRGAVRESMNRLESAGFLSRDSPLKTGALPLANILFPAIEAVGFAPIRLERAIAATRAVEAIRAYAASHDGNLPATLADITDLPIPPDPMTGAPLVYRVEGDHAVIDLPPRAGRTPRADGFRHIVRIRKK